MHSWDPETRPANYYSSQLNCPIMMYDKDGKSVVMTLEMLLPMSFGPEKLLSTDELANGASQSFPQ